MSGRLGFQIVIAASFAACSTGSDRDEVFRSYVDAVNRNAVSAALALHTTDAEFIIPGQTPIRGLEAMRSLLQWDSVLTSRLRFDKGEWRGDTLVISGGSERNAWFAGIGMDSLAYGPGLQVAFSGALIAGVYPSAPTPESGAEFQVRFNAFMTWANANEPSEIAGLLPGGLFVYDRDAAVSWVSLLDRYQRSSEAPTR